MRVLVVGALLLALCACSTAPFVIRDASSYAAEGSAFKDQATVYVIRDLHASGMIKSVNIKLDGTQKGALQTGTYIRFGVSAGQHALLGHWSMFTAQPDVAVSSAFEAGKTYYFLIGASYDNLGNVIQVGTGLGLVRPSLGTKLLSIFKDNTQNNTK